MSEGHVDRPGSIRFGHWRRSRPQKRRYIEVAS